MAWRASIEGWTSGPLACALLIAAGLFLLAVKAPRSVTPAGKPQELAPNPSAALDRKGFAGQWWESFRLVLLLAIGPALIGLALVTAYQPVRVVSSLTTLPDGTTEWIATDPSGTTYVTTKRPSGQSSVRVATDAEIAARPVQPSESRGVLLAMAFLAILTILAHGASVVSLGLALGIWLRRRGRAIAASVGVFLFVTVVWPSLYLYLSLSDILSTLLDAGQPRSDDRHAPRPRFPGRGDRADRLVGHVVGRLLYLAGCRRFCAGDLDPGPQVACVFLGRKRC